MDEKKDRLIKTIFFKFGRSTRIRTLDPLVPNQVRYRAALHSEEQNYRGMRGFSQTLSANIYSLFQT